MSILEASSGDVWISLETESRMEEVCVMRKMERVRKKMSVVPTMTFNGRIVRRWSH
jgi:hypothetical protein